MPQLALKVKQQLKAAVDAVDLILDEHAEGWDEPAIAVAFVHNDVQSGTYLTNEALEAFAELRARAYEVEGEAT